MDTTPRTGKISRLIPQLPYSAFDFFDGQSKNWVAYTPGDLCAALPNHQKRLPSSTLVTYFEKLSFLAVALLGYFGMITLNLKIVMCMCFGRRLSIR